MEDVEVSAGPGKGSVKTERITLFSACLSVLCPRPCQGLTRPSITKCEYEFCIWKQFDLAKIYWRIVPELYNKSQ